MDPSSSSTLNFIIGETSCVAFPTDQEAFWLLEKTVASLEEALSHAITKTLAESRDCLDEDLSLVFRSQEHPLSSQRVMKLYGYNREGYADTFLLTKSGEWWWVSKKMVLGHPAETMKLRRLEAKHGAQFKRHPNDSLFVKLTCQLLQGIDTLAEQRMERARLMAQSTEKPWDWIQRAVELGVNIHA